MGQVPEELIPDLLEIVFGAEDRQHLFSYFLQGWGTLPSMLLLMKLKFKHFMHGQRAGEHAGPKPNPRP